MAIPDLEGSDLIVILGVYGGMPGSPNLEESMQLPDQDPFLPRKGGPHNIAGMTGRVGYCSSVVSLPT
jgi:hypothetical protein